MEGDEYWEVIEEGAVEEEKMGALEVEWRRSLQRQNTITYQPFCILLAGSGVSVLTEENHEYNVLNYINRHARTQAQGASILT